MIEVIFAEFFATNDPITVTVEDGRWEAAGPETIRSLILLNILQMLGGVNASVDPGTYHFNVKSHWFKTYVIFEPVSQE